MVEIAQFVIPEQSPRTQARYVVALTLFTECGEEVTRTAILAATRPNGSMNISKLLRLAEQAYMGHLLETED